ncbi:MAG: hypothetical protein WBG54_03220 [Acidobacteriaceae bacterium]
MAQARRLSQRNFYLTCRLPQLRKRRPHRSGIAPLAPDEAAIRAGRLMLDEIRRLSLAGETFGFETTLAGRSYLSLIRQLQQKGYEVHLFFLWVPNVELLVSRIRIRVMRGGHNVPVEVVRRRFTRSLRNFFNLYRSAATSWIFFDNSGSSPEIMALEQGQRVRIFDIETFHDLETRFGVTP